MQTINERYLLNYSLNSVHEQQNVFSNELKLNSLLNSDISFFFIEMFYLVFINLFKVNLITFQAYVEACH